MTDDRPDLIAGDQATMRQSANLPLFIGSPWVHCDTEAIRAHGAKAVFLGVPFDQATV